MQKIAAIPKNKFTFVFKYSSQLLLIVFLMNVGLFYAAHLYSHGQTSISQTLAGDINHDKKIDILDYNLLADCYGSKAKLPSCSSASNVDLNGDNVIDGIDYNILLRSMLSLLGKQEITPTLPVTIVPSVMPSIAPSAFKHPGILLSKAQLDSVKAKLAAGTEPWASAFIKVKASSRASLTYTPHPVAYVGCGAHNNPDEGCTDEINDAVAAYTQALLWYYTGKPAYAQKSIQIMNAWSSTLIDHKFDTTTYSNGLLQSAWAAEVFTRAAEIIRYSHAGWSDSDISQFQTMLTKAYLPHVINGWKGGAANWELSMADATMDIGVFTNNREIYENGLSDWRAVVPTAIYLSSDGSLPLSPPSTSETASQIAAHWSSPTKYIDGLEAETCRDLSHTILGLEAMVMAAETARIQGDDLYAEQQTRIIHAYEQNAQFLNEYLSNNSQNPVGWSCSNPLNLGGDGYALGWEVAFNHYSNRLGLAMPATRNLLNRVRPTAWGLHIDWETFTTTSE